MRARQSSFRRRWAVGIAVGSVLALAAAQGAEARKVKRPPRPHTQSGGFGFGAPVPAFAVTQALPAPARMGPTPHAGAWGGSMGSDGAHLFVLDAHAGQLVVSDAVGEALARVDVGAQPSQLVVDPDRKRVWVAVRGADRVVGFAYAHAGGGVKLERIDSFAVRDPHGLALSPDGKKLAVTSAAEGRVELWRTDSGERQWSREVGAEPRAVSIDPTGKRLSVGFLTLGAVATIDLQGRGASIDYRALDPQDDPNQVIMNQFAGGGLGFGNAMLGASAQGIQAQGSAGAGSASGISVDARGRAHVSEVHDAGRSYARNAFAVAYLGPDLLAVPHQLSTPVAADVGFVDTGSYGGGGAGTRPIRHRLTMLDVESDRSGHAAMSVHQPRSMAYDAKADRLYVLGYGNDRLLAIDEATTPTAHLAYSVDVGRDEAGVKRACGADGVALTDAGPVVRCEFDQGLRFVDASAASKGALPNVARQVTGLFAAHRDPAVIRGAEIFRRGDDGRLSAGGAMACASCHPEGMTDGLSWRIEGKTLQTPLLTGRITGFHPFKWDGKDADLTTSLRNTVGRLGGSGLGADETSDLQAFLASLPTPRAPNQHDAEAVHRGKLLFASAELNCDACHGGARLSDGDMHDMESDLASTDTPSLIGLARSAPYYHDGSAPTLRALLMDNGRVHGMVDAAQLSSRDIDDLVAYLETL